MFIDPDTILANEYDWKRLVDVYLVAMTPNVFGKPFYDDLLSKLDAAFGINLRNCEPESSDKMAFDFMLRSVVRSYHEGTTPGAGLLEAGLLHSKLKVAGTEGEKVYRLIERINENFRERQQLHLDLIYQLFTMIHGEPKRIVTAAELRAAGFDPRKAPRHSDYLDNL